jgi:hypothetical protein
MNEEIKPFDREMRIVLLSALKRGYFIQEDFKILSRKTGFEQITVEIIDRREQVRNDMP